MKGSIITIFILNIALSHINHDHMQIRHWSELWSVGNVLNN